VNSINFGIFGSIKTGENQWVGAGAPTHWFYKIFAHKNTNRIIPMTPATETSAKSSFKLKPWGHLLTNKPNKNAGSRLDRIQL
jgi:hypothetical protein